MTATVDRSAETLTASLDAGAERIAAFLTGHRDTLVLTGAGCSTESGIPDYRDENGDWKRPQPLQLQEFLGSETVRRRYWARSLAGWEALRLSQPNASHLALARLETAGYVGHLVTQNVDGLHQQAGSRKVTDLHGRLDMVACLNCGRSLCREVFQARLQAMNETHEHRVAALAPDGDAELDAADYETFRVPACEACGGVLKPTVVFFGESVPRTRVQRVFDALERARAVLVVGSSLMVYSGYRFVRAAAERGLPIAAVNLGRTRADDLLALKVREPCAAVFDRLMRYFPTT
jgi:NAD-dependent SIR2 family protein deacetylase